MWASRHSSGNDPTSHEAIPPRTSVLHTASAGNLPRNAFKGTRMDSYDLVVIGTGTAAQVGAGRARKAGRSVAVIDRLPFGGTCALRGCDPKKMLVSGAEAIDLAGRMHGRGVTGALRINWTDLIDFKRTFTDPVSAKREQGFAAQGITAYHGTARFTGRDTLDVDGRTLKAAHVLIASGASPAPITVSGAEHLITSDAFMELERRPARIVMVGGGYIAAEFSHIAARAGAKVTVLQRGERMLPHFDPDVVEWLMEKFEEIGVDVHTRSEVNAVERSGDAYRVHTQTPEGQSVLEADLVVHAAGRVPDIADLDLTAAGVAVEHERLLLNEYLQSVSNPLVYAAGDAAGRGPPLTPVSSHDARVAAANILEGNHRRPDYRGVPSVASPYPRSPPSACLRPTPACRGGRSELTRGWFRPGTRPGVSAKQFMDTKRSLRKAPAGSWARTSSAPTSMKSSIFSRSPSATISPRRI